jgi:DNA-binding NarL/FixJ family response regulator
MIRVLVIDDHPVMRTGLEALLRSEPGFVCVGSAPVGAAARLVRATRPEVVLATGALEASLESARLVVDDAHDPESLFDRLRLAARHPSRQDAAA